MKTINRNILMLLALTTLLVVTACEDTAVLFEDKSTSTVADKSEWTATADSETPPGWEDTGFASALIDGKLSTYWHTDYSKDEGEDPYPHWVLIDMKKENHMISVEVTNRQGGTPYKNGMKKFKLEGSNDGTTFTSLGEFAFAVTNQPQSFAVSSANGYRYLKLTALESQTGAKFTFLSEIGVVITK